jgi:hypothetical protein
MELAMRWRRSIGAIAIALIGCGVAAAAPQPSLFPLGDGSRWTFRSSTVGGARTVGVEQRAGGLVLNGFPGVGPLRVRTNGRTVEVWDTADGRWEALLRFGLPSSSSYRVSLGGAPLWRGVMVTLASKQATVFGSGGRAYRACTRFTLRPPAKLVDAGVLELSFAPGVGPVSWEEQTIDGPREWALASYRPGTTR